MPIGDWLRDERKRLGLSQPAFAELAGTTKQTVFSWETGKTAPDAFQLAALAAAGADVLYILTGQRIGGASAPALQHAVSEGDRILLDNFHAAPPGVQSGVKTTLGAFSNATGQIKSRKRAA